MPMPLPQIEKCQMMTNLLLHPPPLPQPNRAMVRRDLAMRKLVEGFFVEPGLFPSYLFFALPRDGAHLGVRHPRGVHLTPASLHLHRKGVHASFLPAERSEQEQQPDFPLGRGHGVVDAMQMSWDASAFGRPGPPAAGQAAAKPELVVVVAHPCSNCHFPSLGKNSVIVAFPGHNSHDQNSRNNHDYPFLFLSPSCHPSPNSHLSPNFHLG